MTSYKPEREYKPRWFIACGVKPLRQSYQQFESEARDFKSAPKILDLRTDFESKYLAWLMRTDRLAAITTIELSSTNFWLQLYPRFFDAALYASNVHATGSRWRPFPTLDVLFEQWRVNFYPNIQTV
jgi:hypothetical protein